MYAVNRAFTQERLDVERRDKRSKLLDCLDWLVS